MYPKKALGPGDLLFTLALTHDLEEMRLLSRKMGGNGTASVILAWPQ